MKLKWIRYYDKEYWQSKEEVNKVVSDFQTKLVNKYYTDSKSSDYTYGHFVEGVK